MGKIVNYIRENMDLNYKLIVAIATEMIITIILALSYCLRASMPFQDMLFVIWIGVQPLVVAELRLIGKGEVADAKEKLAESKKTNDALIQQAKYTQAIATYAIQLAAAKGKVPESIMANENWLDANDILEKAEAEAAAAPAAPTPP